METTVAALFIHADRSSYREDDGPTPMIAFDRLDAVEGRGIQQDRRYFRHVVEDQDRKRQVSLIDEGTIRRHEEEFGPVPLNLVKAQIVLSGDVDMPEHVGAQLVFEDGPVLEISLEREPCFAMDFIHDGLRLAMKGGNQGALARVISDGPISVGQKVTLRTR